MTEENALVRELKKYKSVCYYPSSGRDMSDLDYFGSGCLPREERLGLSPVAPPPLAAGENADPDVFIHTDVNFYQECAAGLDLQPIDCGIHGACEVLSHRELTPIRASNAICGNFPHSGRVFEYQLKLWGRPQVRTLFYCLCENEFFVAKILLANDIRVPYIWTRDWFGGPTHGTWLANVFDRLQTVKFFTDWLCVPGQRGEPGNKAVAEKYPELMIPSKVRLVKNESHRWIEEGAHGWIEEYDVCSRT